MILHTTAHTVVHMPGLEFLNLICLFLVLNLLFSIGPPFLCTALSGLDFLSAP